MTYLIRLAEFIDAVPIERLIASSIRSLGAADYTSEQIEHALDSAFGLDSQLLADQTYFAVEQDGTLVGCGGWSFRETLFGSDREQHRSASLIEPASGAARIRAFFVHPDHARKGIGSLILETCEQAARQAGFRETRLMATLPGVRLY